MKNYEQSFKFRIESGGTEFSLLTSLVGAGKVSWSMNDTLFSRK